MVLKGMIRLSGLIKCYREARCKLNFAVAQTEYFIMHGEEHTFLQEKSKRGVNDCLYLEQYLRLSVSNMCKFLDGFNPSTMDPIDYVSSSDIKNKFIDICRGKKVIATISLKTGEITKITPENEIEVEDKGSAEKS